MALELKINYSFEKNETNTLTVNVDIDWSQDEFTLLRKTFFSIFSSIEQVELIEGADRMTVRMNWQEDYFYFHFESYCQAAWIEACDQCSHESLLALFHYLKRNR